MYVFTKDYAAYICLKNDLTNIMFLRINVIMVSTLRLIARCDTSVVPLLTAPLSLPELVAVPRLVECSTYLPFSALLGSLASQDGHRKRS